MAPLGVDGDPDGWQDAASAIGSIVSPLQDELDGADAAGGSGLVGQHWVGPVADKYGRIWSDRQLRYGELLRIATQVPGAVDTFGTQLSGFQYRAKQMEEHYTGRGLSLTLDGKRFQLPLGHESLPQELKSFFEVLLKEAESELDTLLSDVETAVNDLTGAIDSHIRDIEDIAFALSPLGIYWAGKAALTGAVDFLGNHESDVDAFEHIVVDPIHEFAEYGKEHALDDLTQDSSDLDVFEWAGRVTAVGAFVVAGVGTIETYRKTHSVGTALADNSGNWADALASGAIDAAAAAAAEGATAALVGVGAVGLAAAAEVAIPIIVTAGVGLVLAWEVNKLTKDLQNDQVS
jgi:hypothetical protein